MVEVTISLPAELYERIKTGAEMTGHTLDEAIVGTLARGHKISDRETAAVTILRQKALEQAVQIAAPGTAAWSITRDAETILDNMLGGR